MAWGNSNTHIQKRKAPNQAMENDDDGVTFSRSLKAKSYPWLLRAARVLAIKFYGTTQHVCSCLGRNFSVFLSLLHLSSFITLAEMSTLHHFEPWPIIPRPFLDDFMFIASQGTFSAPFSAPSEPVVLTTRPRKRKRPSVAATKRQLGGTTSTAPATRLGPPPIGQDG